jgi:hypothetical protein
MHRIGFVLVVVLGLGVGLFTSTQSAGAASGCRAFGQGIVAGEARTGPGVGTEASTFAPANDDVALFKSFVCD